MMRMQVTAGLLLMALLAPVSLCAQESAQKRAEEPLLKVNGALTRVDPMDAVVKRAFHKVYTVKLAMGVPYQIDLVSKDFDAYLRLEDSAGKRLAEDDDGGGDLNARLIYRPEKADAYRVIVTTYDVGGTGKFALTVQQVDEATAAQRKLAIAAVAINTRAGQLYARGKLPEAIELLRKALELRRQAYPSSKYPQGHPDLALSLNNLGYVLQMHEEHAKAEPLYREALAMRRALYPKAKYPLGHFDLAQSLTNMGALLRDQGEYGQAEPFYRNALAMNQALYPKAKHPGGHPDVAGSLSSLGNLLQDQGEYTKAEPLLRDALAMRQALYPKAKYPWGHPDVAYGLSNRGSLFHAQGEYAKAEPLLREALAMRRALYPEVRYPLGHPEIARSLDDLGSLLHDQGEYTKSEPFYQDALAMYRAIYPKTAYPRGHRQLARSINNLAVLLDAEGEFAKAEPLYREALAMKRALYPKAEYPQGHRAVATILNNLATLLRHQKEYAQAELLYREALAMFQAFYPKEQYPLGHPELATGLNNLGALLQDQGEYAKAGPFYQDALVMRQGLYPKAQYPLGHHDLGASFYNVGVWLQAQGAYARAEPHARDAVAMYTQLANYRADVAPESLALNFAAQAPLARDLLLTVTANVPGASARAYEAVWHSRAALTRVFQRRHLALIAATTDRSVRDAWDVLQGLRRQREQLIMAPAPKDPSARDTQLRELDKQIDAVEADLLPRLPALKHYQDLARLGPDALQQRLPAGAVFIDVLRYTHFEQDPAQPGARGETHNPRYVAFVLSRQGLRRVELGAAADIDSAVRAWRAAITATGPADNIAVRKEHEGKLHQQATALRRLVWEPIEKGLPPGTATVSLAPEGDLTQLPWAALPGRGQDRVLLDDYALAVLPHGPFLLEQLMPAPPRPAQRPSPAAGLLLVGGIRYDDRPGTTIALNRGAADVVDQPIVWDYLKGTDVERKLLAQMLAGSGLKITADVSGSDAATSRLRHELERTRYAHLATHGFFADKKFRSMLQLDENLFARRNKRTGDIGERIGAGARSPLVLSGLVCAGANLKDTPERGILSADAVAGLLLDDLHLAVLSACDTGIGDVAGGEGVFGLQRAFHIAGCKNVVASLWKVDDAATAALMVRFYGYLFPERRGQETPAERGLPPIEALRRAQLDLYRHPELIPAWAKGEERGPVRPRPATTLPPADTPRELVTSDGRAPIRLWAAFTLSGLGR